MRVLEAKAIISAVDRTGSTFDRVARKMRRISHVADQVHAKSSMLMRGTVALATMPSRVLAGGAIGYGAARTIKRFAEAEMTLTRIGITADATDEDIAGLQKTIRDLAYATAKPFDQVAEGLNQLVTGGMPLDEALAALPAVTRTAQAAGAEIADISNSSLALGQNFEIAAGKMQAAFDVLVAGGKAGKFELKDMARYLPSIAPAAAAVGMKGEEGLKRVVSMLQAVRMGTGTAEEAAASVQNIFAKMESEQTVKQFRKFGIDLRSEMARARKDGKDLLEVFIGLTDRATKGDLSKIPQLFTDMEFARGMRALLAFKDTYKKVFDDLAGAAGSVVRDLERVLQRQQAQVTRLSESWDKATASLGALISKLGASAVLNSLAKSADTLASFMDWLNKKEATDEEKREPPKNVPELRARMRETAVREELAKTETSIQNAERDLDAAEAAAKVRPGLGRDPGQARRRLEDLRITRELLKLEIIAQRMPYPALLQDVEADPDGPKAATPQAVPLPRRDPRRLVVHDPHMPIGRDPRRPVGREQVSALQAPPVTPLDDVAAIARAIASTEADKTPAKAEITGAADVNVSVEVKTEPGFWSTITSRVNSAISNIRVNGPAGGTTGALGRSMPEVGPAP